MARPIPKPQAVAPFTTTLKPGDYVWHPEISPAGPVIVLVSIPDQVLYVYRNGVRIGRSTVSTGKPGKHTQSSARSSVQASAKILSIRMLVRAIRVLRLLEKQKLALRCEHWPAKSRQPRRLPLTLSALRSVVERSEDGPGPTIGRRHDSA